MTDCEIREGEAKWGLQWSSSLPLIIDSDRPCPLVFYAPQDRLSVQRWIWSHRILLGMRTAQKKCLNTSEWGGQELQWLMNIDVSITHYIYMLAFINIRPEKPVGESLEGIFLWVHLLEGRSAFKFGCKIHKRVEEGRRFPDDLRLILGRENFHVWLAGMEGDLSRLWANSSEEPRQCKKRGQLLVSCQ